MKKLAYFLPLIIALITLAGCTQTETLPTQETSTAPIEPIMAEPQGQSPTNLIDDHDFSGKLEDVSNGQATGQAYAKYDGETYMLYADFENLPPLENGYFYEGWVVRKNPLSIISTGETFTLDTFHANNFSDSKDLTDHDFYVLTLEPDDGDPAPAEHILEGTMTKLIK